MHYLSLNRYLRDTYGEKLYKLSLNGGMTCPNRDGTLGFGGCIFCSAGGSGEFAADGGVPMAEQLARAKERVTRKFHGDGYIGYFQAYTNTYAPVSVLETLFGEVIAQPDIRILSIATRPDCLPAETVSLLGRLNRSKPVWVELGLQTMHEESADFIRRGYRLSVYEDAVKRLRRENITVITHLILGLPGESEQQMLESVDYISRQDIQGVKLQLLHVLKGTELERLYREGVFAPLSLASYAAILGRSVEHLRPDIVIHRLTGDGDKRLLVAPLWSGDKKHVLNTVNRYFEEHDIVQGRLFNCRKMCYICGGESNMS